MIIMGLNGWTNRGHDAGVSLLVDGKIAFSIEEERLIKLRHAYDRKPVMSITETLKYLNLTLDDIDYFSIGWDYEMLYKMFHSTFITKDMMSFELFGTTKYSNKLQYVPHHIAHAYSTYIPSGFNNALVLVLDGQGEYMGTTIYHANNNVMELLMETPVSLGYFYSAVTKHCGFNGGEEGKTMGLASYGIPVFKEKLDKLISTDGVSLSCFFHVDKVGKDEEEASLIEWKNKLSEIIPPRKDRITTIDSNTQPYANLAKSAQILLEDIVAKLVCEYYRRTNAERVCLAGGVSLNCPMASKIESLPYIKEIFTQPAANDGGVSLGAALKTAVDLKEKLSTSMFSPYLGLDYSDEYIVQCLQNSGYKVKKCESIEKVVSKLLCENNIVALFQGRMEYGPRALGNRSLIANPSVYSNWNRMNRLKGRELWRPLAPAVLWEHQAEVFTPFSFSPYMTKNFLVNPSYKLKIPAVTHIDNTARVQSVRQEDNPRFYNIINEFYKLSGIPVVINTSFNIKGEPIVCTPVDAIRAFEKIKVDYLCIGNFVVSKNDKVVK